MRALTVIPGKPGTAELSELNEPNPTEGEVLVRTLAVGICGTDREILSGAYGWAPPGSERLVLGHESLGKVESAPARSGFSKGQLVVGVVRQPDPEPCPSCAAGEWDMCRNGLYREHGIKQLNGFARELYRIGSGFAVPVAPQLGVLGVLLEPTSVVAKAWDQIERIGARAAWKPHRALITGAGPVGLLAALIGVQKGLEVHVLDRVTEGPKPKLVQQLGAVYHSGSLDEATRRVPDVVLECTGVGALVVGSMMKVAPDGIVCLAGVSSGGRALNVDVGALNRAMVLENQVVFGSVNANRRHYQLGADALAKADAAWLSGLVSRRVPLANWKEALEMRPDDVKVVLEISAQA